MLKRISFFSLCFSLAFLASLGGKQKTHKKEPNKKQQVHLQADFVRYNKKSKTLWARGRVKLISKDMEITGDELLYNTENETGKVKGNPFFKQKGTIIKGKTFLIDMKKKELYVESDVFIQQKKEALEKKSKLKEEIGDIVEITCDDLFYQYGEKKGKLNGNIIVTSVDRKDKSKNTKVYGKRANIDGQNEIIRVIDGIKLQKEDGEWLTADEVVINTKEDWIEMKGEIRALLQVEQEKIPETKL